MRLNLRRSAYGMIGGTYVQPRLLDENFELSTGHNRTELSGPAVVSRAFATKLDEVSNKMIQCLEMKPRWISHPDTHAIPSEFDCCKDEHGHSGDAHRVMGVGHWNETFRRHFQLTDGLALRSKMQYKVE